MRRLMVLALALAAPAAHAQTAGYRIAGTAVSAIDQHPLQRASIQITNVDDANDIRTTATDEYGRFVFTGIPKGLFELQGKAPGYLPTLYEEHEGFNTGIVTGVAGVDAESLLLKVLPESTVSGMVANEAAEPVEGAAVRLFMQTHSFGDGRIIPAGVTATDDLGHFELAHVKPGTYFVAVTGAPWYAVHPQEPPPVDTRPQQSTRVSASAQRPRGQPQQKPQPPSSGFTDSVDPSLDVAYSTDFYPGTTDSAHAQPLTIRGGDSRELHFQLAPLPAVSVTIPNTAPRPGQPNLPPQLRMSIFGQLEPAIQGEMVQSPGQTVITGLAPGDYVLSDARNPMNDSHGGMPLHLASRNTEATPAETAAASSAFAHVHVLARSADGHSNPRDLWVALIHPHSTDMVSNQVNKQGQVDLDAPPGDYYFQVEGGDKVLFPRQILSGEQALATGDIHLTAGESRFFTIAFAEGTHTLKGIARKDGKGYPGAFILLFPTSETADIHTFFRQQSDLDGSFSITGVAPGAYTLLAIDGGWDLDWQHDKALAPFLAAAQKIEIPDTAEKTHYLTGFVTVQPR